MPTNEYYDSSGFPSFRAQFSSSALKNEFDNIELGFMKFPAFAGNAGKVLVVNSGANLIEAQTVAVVAAATEKINTKDVSGGHSGLTLFKINFRNALNTITSFFTNSNTVARTYTFQNRDGTIADDTDLALKANIDSPTFTGTPACPNLSQDDNSTKMANTNFVDETIDFSSLGTAGSVELRDGLTFKWGTINAQASSGPNNTITIGATNLYVFFLVEHRANSTISPFYLTLVTPAQVKFSAGDVTYKWFALVS